MFVATVSRTQSRERVRMHAQIATTESTKMLQDKPHARRAQPESLQRISMKRNPDVTIALLDTLKHCKDRTRVSTNVVQVRTRYPQPLRAQHVRLTRTRLKRARLWRAASAPQAILGRMPARAQLVCQASTRRLWGAPRAQIAQPASSPQQVQRHRIHLKIVPEVRSQDQVRVHARIATTGNTNRTKARAHAKRVGLESLQGMTIPPKARARIASLANTNRI